MSNLTTTNGTRALEDYDIAFLEHLKAEGDTIFGECASNEARATFNKIIDEHRREHSIRNALYAADRARVEMMSIAELRAEAPGLYRRLCDERGEKVDPNDPAMQPAREDAEIIALRARMLEILRTLHWSYTFGPLREKLRTGLIKESMVVMIVATAVWGGILALMRYLDDGKGHPFIAVLATVVYAGIMGGVASCMQRLSAVPTRGDALGSIYALKNSRYVLYLAPLSGAVFAVVTMLLFMGQILKGVVFPEFAVVPSAVSADGEWAFTHLLLPNGSANYSLLFLWCFIAGFVERFIPDELTELARRASGESGRETRDGSAPTELRVVTNTAEGRAATQTPAESAESSEPGTQAPPERKQGPTVNSSSGNGDATAKQTEAEIVQPSDSNTEEQAKQLAAAAAADGKNE